MTRKRRILLCSVALSALLATFGPRAWSDVCSWRFADGCNRNEQCGWLCAGIEVVNFWNCQTEAHNCCMCVTEKWFCDCNGDGEYDQIRYKDFPYKLEYGVCIEDGRDVRDRCVKAEPPPG
ncbi:MAG: hypothetical protein KatS3mg015_1513 [Fimbriimonadales bacterium]|nr:MAG: hypothetical protein KatS3mg015_1513 [Fimbriimonadales bacterium]